MACIVATVVEVCCRDEGLCQSRMDFAFSVCVKWVNLFKMMESVNTFCH